MINNILLAGRLTADAELKYTPTGTAICSFNLANNRKGQNGKEETTFIEVVIFGNYAEAMNNYLKKSVAVDVLGKLIQEVWEKEGKTFSKHKIHAKEIDFRTPKNNSNELESDYSEYAGENHEQ